jgi:hypothetical protein
MGLDVRPLELREANAFVARLHRHHPPAAGHRWSLGAYLGDILVGVAIVGRPVARKTAARGDVVEVVRLCTDGTPNACSILYGRAARAADAMGYRRIQTFLLARESGASLKASGWRRDGETPGKAWERSGDDREALQLLLGGGVRNNAHPIGPKVRWVRDFR